MPIAAPGRSLVLEPVGRVVRQDGRVWVDIYPRFAPALDGITGFSHLWVIYWFHGHDTPEDRGLLQVHPRRDPANPLTGVFATRAPVRPNLLGLDACRLVGVDGLRLEVEGLEAQDASPVVDLKPYIPQGDAIPEARTPSWVHRRPRPPE